MAERLGLLPALLKSALTGKDRLTGTALRAAPDTLDVNDDLVPRQRFFGRLGSLLTGTPTSDQLNASIISALSGRQDTVDTENRRRQTALDTQDASGRNQVNIEFLKSVLGEQGKDNDVVRAFKTFFAGQGVDPQDAIDKEASSILLSEVLAKSREGEAKANRGVVRESSGIQFIPAEVTSGQRKTIGENVLAGEVANQGLNQARATAEQSLNNAVLESILKGTTLGNQQSGQELLAEENPLIQGEGMQDPVPATLAQALAPGVFKPEGKPSAMENMLASLNAEIAQGKIDKTNAENEQQRLINERIRGTGSGSAKNPDNRLSIGGAPKQERDLNTIEVQPQVMELIQSTLERTDLTKKEQERRIINILINDAGLTPGQVDQLLNQVEGL